MGRRFLFLLVWAWLAATMAGAEEKAAKQSLKASPEVKGAIRRSIASDPKAREKALAKAAEERPTDVIFLEEVVVLASSDDRKIGRAIAWQEDVTAASRFSFEKGGAFWKGGPVGLWKYQDPMAKDASFSTKPGSPRFNLFQLHP
jgi:hypothetical protein